MKKRKQLNWREFKDKLIDEMGPIFYYGSFNISIHTNLKTIINFKLTYHRLGKPPKIELIKLYIKSKEFDDCMIIDNIIDYIINFIKLVIPTKCGIIYCNIIKIVIQNFSEFISLSYYNNLFKLKLTNWLNLNESYKQLIEIK